MCVMATSRVLEAAGSAPERHPPTTPIDLQLNVAMARQQISSYGKRQLEPSIYVTQKAGVWMITVS